MWIFVVSFSLGFNCCSFHYFTQKWIDLTWLCGCLSFNSSKLNWLFLIVVLFGCERRGTEKNIYNPIKMCASWWERENESTPINCAHKSFRKLFHVVLIHLFTDFHFTSFSTIQIHITHALIRSRAIHIFKCKILALALVDTVVQWRWKAYAVYLNVCFTWDERMRRKS